MRSFLYAVVSLILLSGLAQAQQQAPEELFVPIMLNGMADDQRHFQTLIRFIELSGTTASPAVSIEMDAFDDSGNPIGMNNMFCPPQSPVPLIDWTFQQSLPGAGSVHLGTKGFVQNYDAPAPGIVTGWLRIRCSGPGRLHASAEIADVHGQVGSCPASIPICSRPSYEYQSDATVQVIKPSKAFRVPTVVTPERQAAFAIANPSSDQQAHVDMKFYGPGGGIIAGVAFKILPMHRISRFASEFANTRPDVIGVPVIWPLPERYYGSVLITSDIPIVVGALHVLLPEGKLVASSVAAVE